MKEVNMKRLILFMVSVVLLTTFALPYSPDDSVPESEQPKYYDDAKVLRVKYTQGEAFIRRSFEDAMEEAVINLPIFEKDVAGTTDGRLEIYLGRLNYLRLDYDTEVVFNGVPQLRKTNLAIRVLKGGIYLDLENLDFERDIEIQTPDCGVFLLDKGVYRINVNEGGRTELYVYAGVAEVAGEEYNRKIRENQKVVMFQGRVKERPFYFYASDSDGFDLWSQERNNTAGYARSSSSRYLDDGYEEYEYELSRNGRWRYSSEYGRNIWIPYNVGSNWRPYYNGRWVWSPFYGYTWVPYDTWGYFTHHYGRWHWDPVSHWYWIPGYHWSPAWVHWFWDDYHYGWCASSWWNRPVIVYNGRWWRNHHYRDGIPTYARSSIIVKKGHLRASSVSKIAIKGKLAQTSLAYRGSAPKFKSQVTKVNVVNARGKSMVFKRGGLVSSKYKATTDGLTLKQNAGNRGATYKYTGKSVSKTTVSRYSKTTYSGKTDSVDRGTTSRSYQGKTYKLKPTTSSGNSSYGKTATKSSGYKYKPRTDSGSRSDSSTTSSSRTYKSGSSRSSSGSSTRTKSSVSKSSVSKSSVSKSKSSKSSKSSSKSSSTKVKKKKESPYYSSSYSSGYSRSSGSSSSTSYSSPRTRSSNSYRSYKSSSSVKTPTRSYSSSSSSSSYKYTPRSSSSSSTYKSSYGYRSGSSSRSYSTPSSSSGSSYRSSSTSRSYSRPSSSSSSRSYSKPSSSSRSSYKSSSSRSSSSRSSSSGKSKGSSSKSYKKK